MKNTFIPESHIPKVKGARILKNKENPRIKTGKLKPLIIIGPSDDFVIKLIEELKTERMIIILPIESICIKWNYQFSGKKITFLIENNKYQANSIYFRGAVISSDDPRFENFSNFLEVLNTCTDKVWCRPKKMMTNESKPLQMVFSLNKTTNSNIKIPKTFIKKGNPEKIKKETINKNWIVKSISGVRSLVVDNKSYRHWDYSPVKNIPTLFQEKITGDDVRIHFLKDKAYGLCVRGKSSVDYRYASERGELKKMSIESSLLDYCKNLSKIEKNSLIGIDFIETPEKKYYCLEANPGPGWAWYHKNEKEQLLNSKEDFFLKKFLKEIIENESV
ncbi:MAG: hypothetical protein CL678_16185 [Bdellovibrionaceae bacterium]|nr:hypothetical protein [Pseudobdellovibrionaceae bacterium]|tara:strand:+ start:5418 stop:6416 length:999 start_codon:yes stop_codon:yes gene_type:complete